MSETNPEVSGYKEMFDRSVRLAGVLKMQNILGERTGEDAVRANETARKEVLQKIFVDYGYESVDQMKAIRNNPGLNEASRQKADEALKDLATSLLLAEPRMYDWVQSGNVDRHVPERFKGISSEICKSLLIRDENDTVGIFIVSKLKEVEDFNEKSRLMPSLAGNRKEFMEKIGGSFFDEYRKLKDKGMDDSEDGIKLQQIMIYLEKSSTRGGSKEEKEREERLTNGVDRIDYNDAEQVKLKCKDLLDYLELSGKPSSDLDISGEVTRELRHILNKIIVDRRTPEYDAIRREVKARLALNDTVYFMRKAGGSLDMRNNESIPNIVKRIEENDALLTRENMLFFFGNGNDGELNFRRAWNILQEANVNYKAVCEKAGVLGIEVKFSKPITKDSFYGEKQKTYTCDTKLGDKEIVRKYMVEVLMQDRINKGEDQSVAFKNAERELRLAQAMFDATDESSVHNVSFAGGDDLSECIHFGRFREDDAQPGKTKNAGPDVTRGFIKSLTPGWLRNACGYTEPDGKILAKTILDHIENFDDPKKDFSTYHSMMLGKKVKPLEDLLLDKSLLKPSDLNNMEFYKSKIDLFNKVDPGNKNHLRAYWVAGLLESQMRNMNSQWDAHDMANVIYYLTKSNLALPGQTADGEYFLGKDEWKDINRMLKIKGYFRMDRITEILAELFVSRVKKGN